MGKVKPFHSARLAPGVYHDRDDCPEGKQIPPKERIEGTGGRQRCFHCARTTAVESASNIPPN